MKVALRKMTPDEIAAILQDNDQPRSTTQERTSRGKIQKKDFVLLPAVTKAIRPLNSWIAYRSKYMTSTYGIAISNMISGYYSTIFLSFQQKDISGFLTILWQNDPFKAKWSILAKSYSLIRDNQGKANAPLEKFLAINGPLIGVIEPSRYLEALSWEVALDEGGQTVMRRHENSIDEQLFITNTSVNDVIRNSYNQGYFTGDLSKVLLAKNEAAMTMAASVQPTNNVQGSKAAQFHTQSTDVPTYANAQCFSKKNEQGPTMGVVDDDESGCGMGDNAKEAGVEDSVADNNDGVPANLNDVAFENVQPDTSAVLADSVSNRVPQSYIHEFSSPLKIDANLAEANSSYKSPFSDSDISSLSASAFGLEGKYPFNTEFDPDLSGATFNPFMGNMFNVFDMSDAPWDDFLNLDASASEH